jgi:hypothetical protein
MPDGSSLIRLDGTENDEQATRFDDLADRFNDDIEAEKKHVEGLTWLGETRNAYIERLGVIQGEFDRTAGEMIRRLAHEMRTVTGAMQDVDAEIAQRLRSI